MKNENCIAFMRLPRQCWRNEPSYREYAMNTLIQKPEEVAEGHYRLRIETPATLVPRPGQFINIRVSTGTDPLIRRPFSVYNYEDGALEIIFRVIGKGTEIMRGYEAGRGIDYIGPLGRGFSLCEHSSVLLVGGGVGNAPLYYLARELKKKNNRITYIYGARSARYIYCKDQYRARADDFAAVTDDGTAGLKGFATTLADEYIRKNAYDRVYVCGPTVMMAAIAASASIAGAPVEVSMENYFGCGVGLCSGCTIETTEGLKRACVDGPVLNGNIIVWQSLTD